MRKLLTFLCAALMSVGMFALTPNGTDTWDETTKTLTVNSNPGEMAYYGQSDIENLVISDAVTSIGESAFSECTGLTSIEIPNSVTSIGNTAFAGCSGLTSITIPSSVTSIGESGFANCTGLTSMVVASENTTYDSRDNCNAIIETSSNTLIAGCKNTIIPNSVTSIGVAAFYGCTGLTSTSITIPNSVTSIGNYAFYECYGLTSVTIGNSVTSIGKSAFDHCTGLTSIEIPNSVTSIGVDAFYGCSGLTSVTIGNSVTSIGNTAFSDCEGLTSITIPNSVTSIGEAAFIRCSGLTSVTIGNSVTSIGDAAFYGCTAVADVYCYADPNNLTWNNEYCDDFKDDGSTVCHVHADQLEAYQSKFTGTVNVTFVGDYDVTANLADGAYWATFYTEAGNYQAPDGTQVFAVNLNTTTAEITMTEISDRIVKSGEGVVLKKTTTGNFTMTWTATAPGGNFSNNSLQGTMTEITNPGANNYYVLNNDTYGVGFYKLASDGTIGANKAYLTYSGALARQFFLFDEATGIVELKNSRIEELKSDDAWYSLDGRKLDGKPTTKGLYIVNGKKVIK